MKGCIGHFSKWQIHPHISKGIYISVADSGPALNQQYLGVDCDFCQVAYMWRSAQRVVLREINVDTLVSNLFDQAAINVIA